MKRFMALMLIAMFSVGTLSACNTTKGFGQDVEKVGDKIEGAAKDTGATEPRCQIRGAGRPASAPRCFSGSPRCSR